MSHLDSFLNDFKKSTEELINNPEMIESKKIENNLLMVCENNFLTLSVHFNIIVTFFTM